MGAYRISDVQITERDIVLTLQSGVTLSTPIQRYIRVEKATVAQRAEWVFTEDGYGLNWPHLSKPFPTGMVSVWDLLQDQLYEAALSRAAAQQWQIAQLSVTDQELVALWRLEADVNNGGFMQFLCNWGEENCKLAMCAIEAVGAHAMAVIVNSMYAIVAQYEHLPLQCLSELAGVMSEQDGDQMYQLDQAFWDYPDPLPELVVRYYAQSL